MKTEQLNHLSLLKISGDDAETFLQGQLTNDLTELSNSWKYAGYCSPKGRLLALLLIWREDDGFYALISHDVLDSTAKRLRMFVMRSKVSIEEVNNYALVGLLQRDSLNEALADLELSIENTTADGPNFGESAHGDLILGEHYCVLIINDRALIVRKINTEAAVRASLDSSSLWLQADISQGLPQVTAETVEQFIPQMLNLDLLDGISFKKGCYTGQEIVARMHYLGKLKQRMFTCDLTKGEPSPINDEIVTQPEAGDKVYSDSMLEKAVGTLVSVDHENGHALAVLRLDKLDMPLHLKANYELGKRAHQAYDLP